MLVTIGITTYDRISLLEDTINSVMQQTLSDFKIIVANDNPNRTLSFDNLNIPNDSRIEIINHNLNLGEIENLNWLMNKASTPYFTWLADDDLLHPKYLETLLPVLQNNVMCKAVYTNYFSGETPLDSFFETNILQDFKQFDTQEFMLRYSNRSLKLIGCYGLFELQNLRSMGGFRELGSGHSPGGDTLIPILLSNNSIIYYLDQELVFFRSHPNSISINSDSLNSFITAEIDFIKYTSEVVDGCSPNSKKVIYSQFRMWFQDNHLTVARRQAGSRMLHFLFLYVRSEYHNYSLFRKYKIGLLPDIKYFLSVIYNSISRFLKDCIFPKTRRKIQNLFSL